MKNAQPAQRSEVMPLDTRTPEEKSYDSQHGIAFLAPLTPNPVQVPSHYECFDKDYGVVFEHSDRNIVVSCKYIGPEPQDERGSVMALAESRKGGPLLCV